MIAEIGERAGTELTTRPQSSLDRPQMIYFAFGADS